MSKVVVAGVGMVPFRKPGASGNYIEMGAEAARLALADAGIGYELVQQAYAGYVYGDSACGQAALYPVGMTQIPIINVNNNCSTGSTALYLARQAVESGVVECAIALGFEQMQPGALGAVFNDRPAPMDGALALTAELNPEAVAAGVPMALLQFGGAGKEHMERYGTKLETFAKIRAKASRHAANNPLAVFRNLVTAEQVMQDKMMWPGVMTRLMACPPTCGAAAAILCTEAFARRHGLNSDVRVLAQSMTTDSPALYDDRSMIQVVGFDMAREAACQVYERAGVAPSDVQVVELHDCFAHNELLTYESLGLCPVGEAEKFVEDDDNTYGGKFVTNPSGGLLSKGHPLGATGLAQCYELTHQLRGTAGGTQVSGAKLALQHNLGLGGACVVTLYGRA
ncbi:lipid-transfer protein [Cupriavidus necator]|uniref:lipid-transfer protein n=1 Tax=Cupriavidus necator TaxID=106590 RepID=UPI003ECCF04B